MSTTQTHDVLYKLNNWNGDKVMPRTVNVDGDGDLETELKESLAGRYEVETDDVELVAF